MAQNRADRSGSGTESFSAAELFAGVGGFRLGLEGLNHPSWPDWPGREGAGWKVTWSNQYEPSTKRQHASDCYMKRFGEEGHANRDISEVLADPQAVAEIPSFDLLVGGFPCQDYSVAKVLSQSQGIDGRKGVLWWQIFRMLEIKQPRALILENVDRLLKSPASQRGRDFAIMLWCLQHLGYSVEWRVINAADYGFPQRRRRVFVVGRKTGGSSVGDPYETLTHSGVLAKAFPLESPEVLVPSFRLDAEMHHNVTRLPTQLAVLTEKFGRNLKRSAFESAGVMHKGEVWTFKAQPIFEESTPLGDVLLPESEVPEGFFVTDKERGRWEEHKRGKKQTRYGTDGFSYVYNEGPVAFPEPLDRPSRTILTGEGGRSPSRFKHVVEQGGRLRRLTPVELERLNGFPEGWTDDCGMSDTRRAFMMGNALVVGIVQRIAKALKESLGKDS